MASLLEVWPHKSIAPQGVSLHEPLPLGASHPSTTLSHYLLDHLELEPRHCREPLLRSSPRSTGTILSNEPFASSNCPDSDHSLEALCPSLEADVKEKRKEWIKRSMKHKEGTENKRRSGRAHLGGFPSPHSLHWLLKPLGCGMFEPLPCRAS